MLAATILSSPRAIEVSVYVVRAFVRMRELATSHGELAKRLADLEHKTEVLAISHDTFSRNTRTQPGCGPGRQRCAGAKPPCQHQPCRAHQHRAAAPGFTLDLGAKLLFPFGTVRTAWHVWPLT